MAPEHLVAEQSVPGFRVHQDLGELSGAWNGSTQGIGRSPRAAPNARRPSLQFEKGNLAMKIRLSHIAAACAAALALGAACLPAHAQPPTVTLDRDAVRGGETVTITIRLDSPAPPGGVQVDLGSSNENVVPIPGGLRMMSGGTVVQSFQVTVLPVDEAVSVTIYTLLLFPDRREPVGNRLNVLP